MAIDAIPYAPADDLALPDKTFYPLKIPVSHWQLRHYISHPEPDVLFYASSTGVYYLNTATRKRKHIATLPFEARCTASGYGYVCVGGEDNGHFAVIKLEEDRHSHVDPAVPLDTWNHPRGIPRAADIRVERIGEHIVNSISIHKVQDEEAHLYDIVAVLTNNDATIRIYSLTHSKEAHVIQLNDPMNHATMSPDGKALAAVGDVNTVFFFARDQMLDPPQIPKPHNRLNMAMANWKLVGSYNLYVPGPHTQKGYFTTAWSPRGHLLAVGSEAGYITVFDMDDFERTIADSGGIEATRLVTIGSSRPNVQALSCPGAVRSMLFSPDPWELLIWAEDQGRICIGDLRTALKTKQVVDLDPADKTLHRYVFDDLPSSSPPSPIPRPSDPEPIDGLSPSEQRILDALRTTRQREEALAAGVPPSSINYTSASLFPQGSRGQQALRDYQRQLEFLSSQRHNARTSAAEHDYTLPPLRTTRDEDAPWRIISDAMTLARGPLFESTSATTSAVEPPSRLRTLRNLDTPPWATGANATPRRDAGDLEAGWEILRRRTRNMNGGTGTEVGVRTAGLAISRDGRTVWAATEEGIFEIGVDIRSRGRWAAVDLR